MVDNTIIKPPINRLLFAMMGRSELVDRWWDSPNKAFDGKTPNEIYLSGPDGRKRIADYVEFHAYVGGGS